MPIPPITDHFSAQVIFKGLTGVPADVYTNTFYFRNDDVISDHDEVADRLADDLLAFYDVKDPGVVGGVSIASCMSNQTVDDEFEVRVYDLGQPAPRYPKIRARTLTAMSVTQMPSEVAACLSYVAGENQPRSRGRIYLGPLGHVAMQNLNGRAVIKPDLRLGALGAARGLMLKNTHTWSIWSPTDQQMKPITGAWMDDGFDTVRKRGELPSTRHTIGTYQGQAGVQVPLTP